MEFFLKTQEILLKTYGIFKNLWNQKPMEFFFAQKIEKLKMRPNIENLSSSIFIMLRGV